MLKKIEEITVGITFWEINPKLQICPVEKASSELKPMR